MAPGPGGRQCARRCPSRSLQLLGKTPITLPRRLQDHGSGSWFSGQAANDYCEFGEGVLVGYHHFEKHDIQPLWPSGYGLSYTCFELSDIRLEEQMTVTAASTISVRARCWTARWIRSCAGIR
jgi:beta-glucosidase